MDKLLYLYGISPAEARLYWGASLYQHVLKDKIAKADKLVKKLLAVDKMERNFERIKAVQKSQSFNQALLLEVS